MDLLLLYFTFIYSATSTSVSDALNLRSKGLNIFEDLFLETLKFHIDSSFSIKCAITVDNSRVTSVYGLGEAESIAESYINELKDIYGYVDGESNDKVNCNIIVDYPKKDALLILTEKLVYKTEESSFSLLLKNRNVRTSILNSVNKKQ